MARRPSPLIAILLACLGFSLFMTVYTSTMDPSDQLVLSPSPLFREFTPGEAAREILGLLGDRVEGGPVYMPTQGCETFRFETYSEGILILYYCGDGLKAATYYTGVGESFDPLTLYGNLGGVSSVVEVGGGGVFDVIRVYQSFGEVKILQTGLQVVVDRGTGLVRKIIFYPIYAISGNGPAPPPDPSKALSALERLGLAEKSVRFEGALVCEGSIGYLFTIYHEGWVYPRYAEALVEAYSGDLIHLKLIHEYGVDVLVDSAC